MSMLFQDLKVGDSAIISNNVGSLEGSSQVQRLMVLGLTPGTRFQVTRVAPLGDPIEIRLRGFNLSLRREEAKGVKVDKL
ncbi:FeoA family protein [Oceaniserpentilla sp. 4NH20-0058]|uniref:FeoA family protein n=1 Tax=Oceaniserpentilla sp. 4NH20-0058 TaxID=3127660 RepID=UPI003103260B